MDKSNIIMSWSKCKVEIGETGANDAPAEELSDIGTIEGKTTDLASESGNTLEIYGSGGELVGYEEQNGKFVLKTTVIEPSDDLYVMLGIGTKGEDGLLNVKSHVVGKEMTVKVTPKNKGARGIIAPKCSVSVSPSLNEEKGHGLTITFGILKSTVLDYWYQKFTTKTALE
ncbi:MAG: hypothetical protein MJZ41_07550 [Bacteroidaceae bacterium]|nr:hypothetical protein [Bacteroidaceae bacterium]